MGSTPYRAYLFRVGNIMGKWIHLALAASMIGCASTNFKPKIRLPDPLADTFDFEDKADNMKAADVKEIVVMSAPKLPKGLTIKDGKATITAEFEYEIVGEIFTDTKGLMGNTGFRAIPFYFYDYPEDEASWRKPLCWPQVPLGWITLGLWSIFMPTYYPCKTMDYNSVADIRNRRMRLVNTLKKATKALGATHMLFLGQEPIVFESVQGVGYQPKGSAFAFWSASTVKDEYQWGRAWGLALKKKDLTSSTPSPTRIETDVKKSTVDASH